MPLVASGHGLRLRPTWPQPQPLGVWVAAVNSPCTGGFGLGLGLAEGGEVGDELTEFGGGQVAEDMTRCVIRWRRGRRNGG